MAPSPPTPLPRFTGARGGFCVFLVWKTTIAPLAPGRGEGTGVRGMVLPAPFPQHSSADCFVSREAAKGIATDSVRCSVWCRRLVLFVAWAFQPEPGAGFFECLGGGSPGWLAPSPPNPLRRFTGARGGFCGQWSVGRGLNGLDVLLKAGGGRAKLLLSRMPVVRTAAIPAA